MSERAGPSVPGARAALLLGALAEACAEPPPYVPYDNTRVLEAALAPNARRITTTRDVTSEDGASSHALQAAARVLPLAGGAWVAVMAVSREEVVWSDSLRSLGLVRASAAGLLTLEVRAARSLLGSLGDEAVVVTCDGENAPRAWLSEATSAFVELEGAAPECLGMMSGRAAAPDEFLTWKGALSRWRVDRPRRSFEVIEEAPTVLPPPGGAVVFVEEAAGGALTWITVADAVLTETTAAGSRAATGVTDVDSGVQLWRGADGALRVSTASGLWRWPAAEGPTLLEAAPAPPAQATWRAFSAPGGAVAWETIPNPLHPAELLPTAAWARTATDDAFVTWEAPLTPCCSADACRHAAESYLIGGWGEGPSRAALYDLWTWVGTSEHALVVAGAPLECPP